MSQHSNWVISVFSRIRQKIYNTIKHYLDKVNYKYAISKIIFQSLSWKQQIPREGFRFCCGFSIAGRWIPTAAGLSSEKPNTGSNKSLWVFPAAAPLMYCDRRTTGGGDGSYLFIDVEESVSLVPVASHASVVLDVAIGLQLPQAKPINLSIHCSINRSTYQPIINQSIEKKSFTQWLTQSEPWFTSLQTKPS